MASWLSMLLSLWLPGGVVVAAVVVRAVVVPLVVGEPVSAFVTSAAPPAITPRWREWSESSEVARPSQVPPCLGLGVESQ
jgi:hypothetical protein